MKLSNAARAARNTAIQTFIGLFLISAVGWVSKVAEWASSSGATPLPGLSVLGYAVVSAFCAAIVGLGTWAIRAIQANTSLPGQPPQYVDTTATERV